MASFEAHVYTLAMMKSESATPRKLKILSRKVLRDVKSIIEAAELWNEKRLPIGHDHCTILKCLLHGVVTRVFVIMRAPPQNSEFLIEVPVDEGEEGEDGE